MKKNKVLSASKVNYQKEYLKKQKLRQLVAACLERYSEDEMLEAFSYETDKTYVVETDKDEIISQLVYSGYAIFKTESIQQAEKLKEYAENNVFPYYNEQQSAILF